MPEVEGDNKKGYFEDIEINALNVEMLRVVESDWSHLSPIDAIDAAILDKKGFTLRAVNLLRNKTADCSIFGFKDPRTAKLMPFWSKVFDSCGFEVSYVLAIRNPMSVVQSLKSRAAFSPEHSYMLWLGHVLASIAYTCKATRVLVDFDHFMLHPREDLERIAERLDLSVDPEAARVFETEFLESELQHTVFSLSNMRVDPTCPPLVMQVYTAIIETLDNPELDEPEFENQVKSWSDEFDRMKVSLRWIDYLIAELHNVYRILQYRDGQVNDACRAAIAHDKNFFATSFNPEWYAAKYQDVATSGLDPYAHYVTIGLSEGREPSADSARFLHDALIDRFKTLQEQVANSNALLQQRDAAESAVEAAQQKISELKSRHAIDVARLTQECAAAAQAVASLKKIPFLEDELKNVRNEFESNILVLEQCERKLNDCQTKLEAQLSEARERDRNATLALDSAKKKHEEETTKLIDAHVDRERALFAELAHATQIVASQMQYISDREMSFVRQSKENQLQADRQRAIALQSTADREQAHRARLATLQQEFLARIKLEESKAEEILETNSGLATELIARKSQSRSQAENERRLSDLLNARNEELQILQRRLETSEAAHVDALQKIVTAVNTLRKTYFWRMTAPLRALENNGIGRVFDTLLKPHANSKAPVEISAICNTPTENGPANMSSIESTKSPATADQLLTYSDRDFVAAAYQAVLSRAPDADGMHYYLGRLRSGISKLEILQQLQRSAEAKNNTHRLPGLDQKIRQYQMAKLPVLGPVLRLLGMRVAESSPEKNIRAILNHLYVLDADSQNQFSHLNNELQAIRKEIALLADAVQHAERAADVLVKKVFPELPLKKVETSLTPASSKTSLSGAISLFKDNERSGFTVLPSDWPHCAATSVEIDTMIERLVIRTSGTFVTGGYGFKNEARNRHPYRMLSAGESVNQYFKCADSVLSSLTLYFYTYDAKKNGARVRINLYVILPDLKESVVSSRVFEGDDITDCAAVHLWFTPEIPESSGQLFRIEIAVERLEEGSHITVALGESSEDTIRTFDVGTLGKCALSFRVNKAPSPFSKKYFAFISGCPGDAFRYRCVHLGEALARLGYGVDIFQPGEQDWKSLGENYKVVVLHRIPYDSAVEAFLARAKNAGIIVVFDTDDLVFNPDLAKQIDAYNEMSPAEQERYYDGLVRYHKTLAKCDAVTVSTEKLGQEVARLWPDKPIEVLRNRISREMWDLALRARTEPKHDSQEILIAYFSGSKTHRKDFATCEQALQKLLTKYKNATLLIVGHLDVPRSFDELSEQIRTIPFVAWESLASLYRKVDINLAPLEYDVAFTESKSELKFLEAALLEVPTVAARLGAYEIAIEDGVDGILCGTPDEWFFGIERLVVDVKLRERMGKAAREKVEASCTTFRNGTVVQEKFDRLIHSLTLPIENTKRSIAFIVRAPIAKTGGGYKKIFILANYLKKSFDVKIYVDPIAHMAEMSDAQIAAYCEVNFSFDAKDVRVGYDQIEPVDFAIATNWPTAAVTHESTTARVKFYFVQDYEPEFYTKDDQYYDPAEASYDLGLGIITIGEYLRSRLASRGGWCKSVPFAMDESFLTIDLRPVPKASAPCSIIFFARPGIPRRNFEAGIDALRLVNKFFPNVQIKLYGLDSYLDLSFPYENLGQLSQEALASTMSDTDIHLSYSLTNISTVIYEAMAAGCACVEADVEAVRPMVKNGYDCMLAEPTGPGTFKVLSKLIESPSLRLELGRNAQAFAKTLNEENMCREFESLIEQAWMLRT